jgi:RNA polymerase sigma-70 factor (ECF subfamily)
MTGLLTDRPDQRAAKRGPIELEQHRGELTGFCYRMLGSAFEAEDAVQDTMVRAWRASDRFEGRSSVRSWLYRIATNVCLDMLKSRKQRALPMDLATAATADSMLPDTLAEHAWVEPIPDGRVFGAGGDPAEQAVSRETIRLAFVTALQHLPPRQRAVLILRDVLCWRASEVARLLETTVASVNSALQRARTTLADRGVAGTSPSEPTDDAQRRVLARYVDTFERFDIEALVSLLREDATHSMPPYPMWLRGSEEIGRWLRGPGAACRGSRLVPVGANGSPAFAQYRASGPGGSLEPFSVQVLDVADGKITGFTHFLEPQLFPLFGLPARPEE